MLEPFQRAAINHFLQIDPATGRRKHKTCYWGMPRKNGKSTIGAALAIYFLVADGEPGAEVYAAAGDRQQARIVFEEAKRMVLADPDLSEEVTVMRDALYVKSTSSVYRVLSADAKLQQGLNPHAVIFDEVHVQPDDELWTALTMGSGTRREPIVIGITTAGVDEDSLAYRLYAHGRALERGEVKDHSYSMIWHEPADPQADYRDPAVWREANPMLQAGVLKEADFADRLGTAQESQFRRYRLNQWVASEEYWLPYGAWESLSGDVELDPDLPVAVAIDIGIVHDATAVVIAQVQGDTVAVSGRYWMNPYPEDTSQHDEWRMPLDEVVQYLRDLRVRFPRSAVKIDNRPVPGPAYVYDRYGLASTELALEAERGFALIPVPQQGGWMIEASRRFYEAVRAGKIVHDGDPVMAAHLRNVVPRQVGESGWRLEKATKRKKIDAAVAVVMAVSQALERPPAPRFRAFVA